MASTGGRHGSTNQCLSIHNPELLVVEITTTLNQSSAAVSECTEKYNYTVSQKNKQNYFFITTSNFHQIRQFLAQRWLLNEPYLWCTVC